VLVTQDLISVLHLLELLLCQRWIVAVLVRVIPQGKLSISGANRTLVGVLGNLKDFIKAPHAHGERSQLYQVEGGIHNQDGAG
jgi:hypothetical protein